MFNFNVLLLYQTGVNCICLTNEKVAAIDLLRQGCTQTCDNYVVCGGNASYSAVYKVSQSNDTHNFLG